MISILGNKSFKALAAAPKLEPSEKTWLKLFSKQIDLAHQDDHE